MQINKCLLILALLSSLAILGCSANKTEIFSGAPTPAAGSPSTVTPDSVVTLEEFGDYQCPPCGALHPTLKKLKQEMGPRLNFVFRNLPLTSIHKNSLAAAQAAEAARVQDHFWQMHDLLYESQDLWKDDVNPRTIFIKFASDLGLDTQRFTRDMDDKQVNLRIQTDQQAAEEMGIIGTPTVLLNGRQLRPEATTEEGIRKGIDFLATHKQPTP